MPIEVSCRKCGKAYRVKDERAGTKIRCKDCQTVIEVPQCEEFFDVDGEVESYADTSYSQQPVSAQGRKSRPSAKTKAFPPGHLGNDPVWMNWLRFAGACIGGVVAIIGVISLISIVLNDLASRNWPETTMKVTNVVRELEVGRPPKHCVYLDYSFEVDGQKFERKRQSMGSDIVSSNLDGLLTEFAAGTQHPVYFNPSSPGKEPQIERGGQLFTHLFGVLVAAAFAIICPFFAFRMWQMLHGRL